MKAIIINGPMGVGKTTVGRAVADKVPGTAFIDGDWCLDIHPFTGNRETKAMAVDNILHMVENYGKCSLCNRVVLAWLMDDPWVLRDITEGISRMGMEVKSFTLVCDRENLAARWQGDEKCDWRTDQWLKASLKSLAYFSTLENPIDTCGRSVEDVADMILKAL